MSIKICADTTCDLPEHLLRRWNIDTIPLYVIKNGEAFRDNVDITTADIFAHVAAGGALCSTSAVSEADYKAFFRQQLQTCDGVVHVTISSDMSACYQNACRAAEQVGHVRVIDSRNLSVGEGLIVLKGARMAAEGDHTLDEIADAMEALIPKVDCSFVIDKLDYLRKGGRCSPLAALGANVLSLKPCIAVRDGAMLVEKKYRGKFDKVLLSYVEDRLKDDTIDPSFLFVVHTTLNDGVLESVKEKCAAVRSFGEVEEADAGCTIACHCGPNTLGVIYLHK